MNNKDKNLPEELEGVGGIGFKFNPILITIVVILGIVVITGGMQFLQGRDSSSKLAYTQLLTDIKDSKVTTVEICQGEITAKYKDDTSKKVNATSISVEDLRKGIKDENLDPLKINIKECSNFPSVDAILGAILNIGLLVGLAVVGYMVIRSINNSGNKALGFGISKARLAFGSKQDVKFSDVAGIDEARDEVEEIVQFLKDPEKFQKMGARIPKGILMTGAPGTGKTLLARAIAGEAGVPFFITSGPEFEEMVVGAGASKVRDLFAKAKRAAPALIFIDEIDAIGERRGYTHNSQYTQQTLNQILVEMDGFEKNTNVLVIAATNRPDVLDPALTRPGRFDRKVNIDLPDIDGRKKILEIHSRNKPLASDVSLERIAKRTTGFSGADLENILNEAAIMAAKAGRKEILEKDIEEASIKVIMGSARRRKRNDKILKTIAYHEAGHAVVSKFAPEADPVHKITIVSRGMSGGMTMHMPEEEEMLTTKTRFLSEIKVLMAGHIAEKVFMNDITTGASNDIDRATEIANRMVRRFGMSDKVGLIRYAPSNEGEIYNARVNSRDGEDFSEDTAKMLDLEVKKIMDACYIETEKIINEHKEQVEKLKDMLLEKEVVNADEFNSIF
jgi:cell division protease FtsH